MQQEDAGERLDRFLVRHCPGLGRRAAAGLIERGLITVGGRRANKAARLAAGDVVCAPLDFGFAPPSEEGALDVRLERHDLVVVDKPAGQPTAPLAPGETGTLAGALLARYPEMRGVGYREREPGIIHRLDTRTSGLVVAARNALAFEALRDALRAHRIDKRYLAIVDAAGLPDEVRIELPLALEPSGSGRVIAHAPGATGAMPCASRVRVLERRGRFALVEVEASRAFRHQVRVHLAASGWPIAGDLEYGGARSDALSGRHALHASQVAWAGDERVPAFAVDSPLPADLVAFLAAASGLAAGGASIRQESS
ncbi:MAG TPA: pseudouridine synthase [Polyangiaceae bacterium]|nr:pseudouridine synthase [Polyangiaceae bacterium]